MTNARMNYSEIFHKVVVENDIKALRSLLQNKDSKDFDIDRVIKNKSSALHLAMTNKNVDMVRLLLENGARIDFKNEAGSNCLELAAKLGEHDLVNLCLQRVGWIYGLEYPIKCKISSLKQNFIKPRSLDTNYNVYDVIEFLLRNKADPNIQCSHTKNTPLHNVMGEGPAETDKELQISLIKLLLAHGADPNMLNNNDDSPFHESFKSKNTDLVCCFINGRTNLFPKNYKKHIIYLAVTHGMPKVLQRLIQFKRENRFFVDLYPVRLQLCYINATSFSNSKKCIAIMKLLIELGADVNRPDVVDRTALYCAAKTGYFDVVKYLVEMGADLNGHWRNRPLFAAVHTGHLKVFEFLISRGANLELGVNYSHGLLHYAVRFLRCLRYNGIVESNSMRYTGHYNIILFLLEKGMSLRKNDKRDLQKWQIKIFDSLQEEIMSMKKITICDNLNVTYFDILVKKRNALERILLLKEVKMTMRSGDYKKLFVNFADRLETKYMQGLTRLLKSVALRMMLSAVFPESVIAKITDYLSDAEMETIFQ